MMNLAGILQKFVNGAACVTTASIGAVDTRVARFNAAADMPLDITSNADVTADMITITGISATARKVQFLWHSDNTFAATAGAGPIAIGARITLLSSPSAVAAAGTLTYAPLTGGGASAAGTADLIELSPDNPIAEVTLPSDFSGGAIYLVGIPAGVTPTNIVPAFCEVRILG